MSSQHAEACSLCGEISTTPIVCDGCKDTQVDESAPSTNHYYCSTACKDLDWRDHGYFCASYKQRQCVYRAGHVAQQVFLILREHTYNLKVVSVEEANSKLRIHLDSHPRDVFIQPYLSAPGSADKHKNALLCYAGGVDAVRNMQYLMRKLVPDSIPMMREAFLLVDGSSLDIYTDPDTSSQLPKASGLRPRAHHCFWVCFLPHELCAIDLSAPQFLMNKPVMPLKEHRSEVQREHCYFHGLNYLDHLTRNRFARWASSCDRFKSDLALVIMKHVNKGINEWDQSGTTLKDMLHLPRDEYMVETERFLTHIKTVVSITMEKLHGAAGMLERVEDHSVVAGRLRQQYNLEALGSPNMEHCIERPLALPFDKFDDEEDNYDDQERLKE